VPAVTKPTVWRSESISWQIGPAAAPKARSLTEDAPSVGVELVRLLAEPIAIATHLASESDPGPDRSSPAGDTHQGRP
jgi:hypothetical protein